MRYYIQRGEQQFGPYSIIDLRRYVSEGNVVMNDMARREDSTEWAPVSQVLSGAGAPPPPPPVQAAFPAAQPQPWGAPHAAPRSGPIPPDLHWAFVLLIGIVTCGLFTLIWFFVEANFVKKIDRSSNAILVVVLASVLELFGGLAIAIGGGAESDVAIGIGGLTYVLSLVLWFVAVFGMRSSLLRYYNETEPFGLRMNPVATFFFNLYQFQYHFSRIAQWKKTGVRPL